MNALLSALLLIVSSVSCFAHGSMGNPISRVHQVFLERILYAMIKTKLPFDEFLAFKTTPHPNH